MPSLTPAIALIRFHESDGFPWTMPTWQDLTGIKHGLFPDDDKLLPRGWTRRDAEDVQSYFNQYKDLSGEDQKKKFSAARDPSVPGRKVWADFVSKSWAKWGVHGKIVECLYEQGVHPVTLIEEDATLESWPHAEAYIPIAIDAIALQLFGQEAFGESEKLPFHLRKVLSIFVQRSWARIRVQFNTDKEKLPQLESAALTAFDSVLLCLFLSTH
jgi:hypothetical protein